MLVIPDDEMILTRMCFLNEQDVALINKHRRPANRLGFTVLLCYLRGPGFIPDKSSVPHNGIVSRVASRLKLQPDLWQEYASREQTRWEHLTELYRYLKLSPFSRSLQKDCNQHISTRQYNRIFHGWVEKLGLEETLYSTHSMRRTKPYLIYKKTKNLRVIQLLLGHKKLESTVRYLGIEVDDALEISESIEV